MRYLVTPKASVAGDYLLIKNDDGQDVFWVESGFISPEYYLRDMFGNEVAVIQGKSVLWGMAFEIYKDRRSFAFVKKKLPPFFKDLFTIEVQGTETLIAESDHKYLKYTFHRGGKLIATASPKRGEREHGYIIDIIEQDDDVLILACTLKFYSPRNSY